MTSVGHIASACINQYRSRDIFAYLGLRYCLETDAAKADEWAEANATQAVFAKKDGAYLRSYHFKQVDENGAFEARDLFIPSIPEALAEIALLRKCAKAYNQTLSDRVFSYRLDDLDSSSGAFDPYMKGLRERQSQIASACRASPQGKVVYIDIAKFYPSISPDAAVKVWQSFCAGAELEESDKDLGLKLIQNYRTRSDGKSILTGPMFSHFIANLILRSLDDYAQTLGVDYFRYVDDITVVGEVADVDRAIELIRKELSAQGLQAHSVDSAKTLTLSTGDWLESSTDFSPEEHSIAWMRLVGDIKKLLIFETAKTRDLEDAILVAGGRLPIPDYAEAVREVSSFKKIRRLGLWGWLKLKTRAVTVSTILTDLERLRKRLYEEAMDALARPLAKEGYERKRAVSRLRYRLGRLVLIGQESMLINLVSKLNEWPELTYHQEIMKAILTGDCANVVAMGSNVAQAVAQIFRPTLKTATFSRTISGDKDIQGLAVFILNGVPVEAEVANTSHPLLRFARGPIDRELMSSPRGLLQEIACLHGLGEVRHPAILKTAFDIDESMIFDALEMDYGYSL